MTEEPASQSPVPETRAGAALAKWLTAFNSGESEQIRPLAEANKEGPPLEQLLGLREMTGGFFLLRIEKSEPSSLTALVQERAGDTVARLELSVSSDDPAQIAKFSLLIASRPPDLAIPRMTETEALKAVSAYAADAAESGQFSGALLIARNEKVLLQEGWGVADRKGGTAVTLDTQFRLGSMNKMFTSIATLQLIESGELALDDTVGKHLPDYPNKDVASKVTVRHLLTHTGGTGDIFGPDFTKNRLTLQAHSDYVKLYGERGLTHEPGTEHQYSNYGFVLLGTLIEEVSGMTYYEYVRSKIFEPAGMESTDSMPETAEVPRRAVGYMKHDDSWVSNADTLPWRGTAAGGGYSTVGDLLRFARALESGALISKALLAEATRAQAQQYGYGFGVSGEGPMSSYGHNGGAPGMNGSLLVFPQLGYVVVGLSNLDPPVASRVVDYFASRMPATHL